MRGGNETFICQILQVRSKYKAAGQWRKINSSPKHFEATWFGNNVWGMKVICLWLKCSWPGSNSIIPNAWSPIFYTPPFPTSRILTGISPYRLCYCQRWLPTSTHHSDGRQTHLCQLVTHLTLLMCPSETKPHQCNTATPLAYGLIQTKIGLFLFRYSHLELLRLTRRSLANSFQKARATLCALEKLHFSPTEQS